MNEPLHPLTLSEILDRTAQLYRSRFLVFLGIGTIPAGTVFVFAAGVFAFFLWMGVHQKNGGTVADSFVWTFLILIVALAIPASLGASAVGEAAMSDAAARLFLGDKITIRSAYKATWKRGWRYVGLYLLQGLVIVGAPAVVFFIAMFAMIAGKVRGVATNDNSPLFAGPPLFAPAYPGGICCLDAAASLPCISSKRCRTGTGVERAEARRHAQSRVARPHSAALCSWGLPEPDPCLVRHVSDSCCSRLDALVCRGRRMRKPSARWSRS